MNSLLHRLILAYICLALNISCSGSADSVFVPTLLSSGHSHSLSYPTNHANLAGTGSTTLRGRIVAPDSYDPDIISSILVDGVEVVPDTSGAWSRSMSLSADTNAFSVIATFTDGSTVTDTFTLYNRRVFKLRNSVVYDESRQQTIFYDDATGSFITHDAATGSFSTVSGNSIGSGPDISSIISDVLIDVSSDRILLRKSDRLLGIDLASGNRVSLSSATDMIGTGPSLVSHSILAFDPSGNRVFALDDSNGEIVIIDLTTSNRASITIDNIDDLDSNVIGMDFDSTNNRLLIVIRKKITGGRAGTLIAVDTTTGVRSTLWQTSDASNLSYFETSQWYDATNNRMLIGTSADQIMSLDITNGSRSFSSAGLSDLYGHFLSNPDALFLRSSGELLMLDTTADAIASVTSGSPSTSLFRSGTGFIEPVSNIDDMVYDSQLDTIYSHDNTFLQSIDLGAMLLSRIPPVSTSPSTLPTANARGFDIDISTSRVYLLDFNKDLYTNDIGSQSAPLLSANLSGDPGELQIPHDVLFVPATQNVYVTDDNSRIIEIDALTGDRRVLTSTTVGSGTTFGVPRNMVYRSTSNSLLVSDSLNDAVYEVFLDSGNRRIVSNSATGAGPVFDFITDITIDSSGLNAITLDRTKDALLSIDLDSGDRSVASDSNTGTGIPLQNTTEMSFDSDNNRAFVADGDHDAIFVIDLHTGNRAIAVKY